MILKKVKNEIGATAIEYGLIASLVAVVAVTGMSAVGRNLSNTYCTISKHLGGSGTCSGASTGNANGGGSTVGSNSNGANGGGDANGSGNSTTGNEGINSIQDMDNLIKSLKDNLDGRYLDTSLGGTDGFSEQPLTDSLSIQLLSQMTDHNQNYPDDKITNVFGLYDAKTQHPITSWSEASKVLKDAINNPGYIENNIHTGNNNGPYFEVTTQQGHVVTIDGLLNTMMPPPPTYAPMPQTPTYAPMPPPPIMNAPMPPPPYYPY
ncbi:hypothetical protein CFR75_06950 [Komagataeibacter xylinus]|uniref:Flp family type IVb pilin n=1 Tax=Komagataeibacter xylinus TaxID=28448 RepID=A0A318Q3S8_KOMXY|nr:Flp family type IVb pilin [Komagataeibacter xylinus]PYD57322.1 hypothetical protein CFR75_06950 [Komagataeibacter xylinus]GBQ75715.1 hypothetical protein AA15237_2132 [Komagataeibacter xylinus NBRC 15237]